MVQGIVTILNPDGTGWNNYGITLNDEVNFDDARQRLMQEFAKVVVGETFPDISTTDAWNLWQTAERNGFRFHVIHVDSAHIARSA